MKDLLYHHFLEGLVTSEHRHFGGDDCYNEIPFAYHLIVCSAFTLLILFLIIRWKNCVADETPTI